ncbi:MAG: hypothetical protein QXP28_08955 [Archaeoglobaceae archaeon]
MSSLEKPKIWFLILFLWITLPFLSLLQISLAHWIAIVLLILQFIFAVLIPALFSILVPFPIISKLKHRNKAVLSTAVLSLSFATIAFLSAKAYSLYPESILQLISYSPVHYFCILVALVAMSFYLILLIFEKFWED